MNKEQPRGPIINNARHMPAGIENHSVNWRIWIPLALLLLTSIIFNRGVVLYSHVINTISCTGSHQLEIEIKQLHVQINDMRAEQDRELNKKCMTRSSDISALNAQLNSIRTLLERPSYVLRNENAMRAALSKYNRLKMLSMGNRID